MTELASTFNGWYSATMIADPKNPNAPYNVALAEAATWVIKNGLYLLGISVPEKM